MVKILKRINYNTLNKILVALDEHGECNKSSLARRSNMSYDNCMLYLDFIEMFELIKRKIIQKRFLRFYWFKRVTPSCRRKFILLEKSEFGNGNNYKNNTVG